MKEYGRTFVETKSKRTSRFSTIPSSHKLLREPTLENNIASLIGWSEKGCKPNKWAVQNKLIDEHKHINKQVKCFLHDHLSCMTMGMCVIWYRQVSSVQFGKFQSIGLDMGGTYGGWAGLEAPHILTSYGEFLLVFVCMALPFFLKRPPKPNFLVLPLGLDLV